MTNSIFSKIIAREVPAHFIYEDDICVAILDKFPTVSGQSLVIPKKELDYAFDLDDETYLHLFTVAKKIARASDLALQTARTCLVVEGFEVPHTHIKLYPMPKDNHDLGSLLSGGKMADDETLAAIAEKIKSTLAF
ncbi:hypothetical protein A2837_02780 [Candidatus Kaiserbacteria bacterium RIFCSPHIGHO2_01_FULL_46_22]|uniref:HIT domain-containing protein n=1 Tax=Candidatus Kaiserbacteria bacterium RIFCSPHIGHO2_01_FULL_46_22 TaxID=1798475 RepID=A0A1F6BX55_9BACT|nr:MAG: hypothetical protein A2837_02780 [Candidatus Kaiserbacteria bacterium RIFCSPHIGHO2_01_FULL_46_22]